ncbi:hypothetical protein KH389_24695 [Pseudomonas qingdaonensis]|uniref:Uncharacterized protein n=1 Tax=Pseudomonas qingdaonensis TaxID=2056231 RepID=A0ABX8DQH4_9PSED|nr:hypothetical protein [Pseudomonas qingdaonensis]QVL18531.1 hypothetical protein KH389_24695 [Pseudomonas qingdaonensis]
MTRFIPRPHGSSTSIHADPSTIAPSAPTQNPNTSEAFNVVVSIPDNIQIRMVDASALGDYEVWVFIASIVSNFVIGFLISYIQEAKAGSASATYVLWNTIAFSILLAISLGVAIFKRIALRKKGRQISLKTSGATDVTVRN